jgi:hypothetical protein
MDAVQRNERYVLPLGSERGQPEDHGPDSERAVSKIIFEKSFLLSRRGAIPRGAAAPMAAILWRRGERENAAGYLSNSAPRPRR